MSKGYQSKTGVLKVWVNPAERAKEIEHALEATRSERNDWKARAERAEKKCDRYCAVLREDWILVKEAWIRGRPLQISVLGRRWRHYGIDPAGLIGKLAELARNEGIDVAELGNDEREG